MESDGLEWIHDEDELLRLVADALDEVPPYVAQAGRAAYTRHKPAAELADTQPDPQPPPAPPEQSRRRGGNSAG